MKSYTYVVLTLSLIIGLASSSFTGCGGSSTSEPVIEDQTSGGDTASEGEEQVEEIVFDSKSATQLLADVIKAAVIDGFGLSAEANLAKAIPAPFDSICTENVAISSDCPGGGTIDIAGSCEFVQVGGCEMFIPGSLTLTSCATDDGVLLEGAFEGILRVGFSDCDPIGGIAIMWYATSEDGITIKNAKSEEIDILAMLLFDAEDTDPSLSSQTIEGGELYGCAIIDNELTCESGDPSLPINLCDGDAACETNADCDGKICDRGCCTESDDTPEQNALFVCEGMRECTDNAHCYHPSIHMYCEDGVCQPPCLNDDVCRNGAKCLSAFSDILLPNDAIFQNLFGTTQYDGYYNCVCIFEEIAPPPPPGI